jgi:hypothetical protein
MILSDGVAVSISGLGTLTAKSIVIPESSRITVANSGNVLTTSFLGTGVNCSSSGIPSVTNNCLMTKELWSSMVQTLIKKNSLLK